MVGSNKKSIVFCSLALTFIACPHPSAQTFQSFVRRIQSVPIGLRKALTDSFMQATTPFPVTEDSLAHFIIVGDSELRVSVAGDFNDWNPRSDSMRFIRGIRFRYLTKRFEKDARLEYKFILNDADWILDPMNPRTVRGGFGPNSELAMPDYVQPAEILFNPSIPRGSIDTLQFHSAALRNDRKIFIYLPPSYFKKPKQKFPSVYLNDGGEYITLGSMVHVLDNLIHRRSIREIIAVFVDPVDRNSEYWLNNGYVEMLVGELIPWIEARYRVLGKSSERGIMGVSLGGLSALYGACLHPDAFGLCASQSGAVWIEGEKIVDIIRSAPIGKGRFYIDWGSYEPSISGINSRIQGILLSKGCGVKALEFHEGHSWGNWRAHLDEILIYFFPLAT